MLLGIVLMGIFKVTSQTKSQECQIDCSVEDTDSLACAFDLKNRAYKMFPSKCAMDKVAKCNTYDIIQTPLEFCIKEHQKASRRLYGESCPVFCPSHYRPVCGASKYKDYAYRSFVNGCYLDMLNCRGDDEYAGYVEVPLQFCQKHHMKNIFKEKLIMSNMFEHADYV